MKKTLCATLSLLLLTLLCGCRVELHLTASEPSESTSSVAASSPTALLFDEAALDLDEDGVAEDCALTFGPTSGLFTVIFTASENGTVKYQDTFVLTPYELHFDLQDGVPYLVIDGENHRLSVADNRIVIDGLADGEGYWG